MKAGYSVMLMRAMTVLLLGKLCASPEAIAADKAGEYVCPMHAPPIDKRLLLRHPGVQSVSLSADRLRAAVLLKDGNAIQIYHIGCAHVGFEAVRWIDELPASEAQQLQAIRQLIHLGLQDPGIKSIALDPTNFDIEKTDARVYFRHRAEDLEAVFSYQLNGRYLLSVSYALPY